MARVLLRPFQTMNRRDLDRSEFAIGLPVVMRERFLERSKEINKTVMERIAGFISTARLANNHWEERLSWSQKISRLGNRMRDPEWRRYGRLLLAGKLLGVALLFCAVILTPELLGWSTFAADGDLKGNVRTRASGLSRVFDRARCNASGNAFGAGWSCLRANSTN